MNCLAIAIDYSAGLPLIVGAGISLYVASKALADALVAGDSNRPGRLAIGQWLPIAMLGIAAAVSHRPAMAVGLVFSTSVACLSLSIGAVGFMGTGPIPHSARRTWPMLVPVGLLALLAGFRATISFGDALILLIQGLCVCLLWQESSSDQTVTDTSPIPMLPSGQGLEPLTYATPGNMPGSEKLDRPPAPPGRGMPWRIAQFILGLLLAGVGAWFAMHSVDLISAGSTFANSGLLTATLISPLLVLPMIGTGTEMAQRNESVSAISSQVAVALLNVCALLPLIVLGYLVRQCIDAQQGQRSFALPQMSALPFPLAVWRVDVVVFIALGAFLLPVAMGRWSLSKFQGLGLMMGYGIYLLLTLNWQTYSLFGITIKWFQ